MVFSINKLAGASNEPGTAVLRIDKTGHAFAKINVVKIDDFDIMRESKPIVYLTNIKLNKNY